jgi:hypothetical protein
VADVIKIDTSSFNAAIREYAAFDKREFHAIINAKLGDWAWEAAKVSPVANREAIKALASMSGKMGVVWWRFINTCIQAGQTIKGRRKATVAESMQGYIDKSTGEWILRRKTVSTFRKTNEQLKANDYERVSRQIIRRRAAKVKSFVAQFLFVALKLGKRVATVGGKNSWKYEGIETAHAKSGSMYPKALFSIPWKASVLENKRHDGARSSREQQKLSIATRCINHARDRIVVDMQRKTAERYARKAAQLSGRAA